MRVIILIVLAVIFVGCASYPVTLIGQDNDIYEGKLTFHKPYSGTIIFREGPGKEIFEGPYNVVDRTAYSRSFFGGTQVAGGSSASAEINATGKWIGKGNLGSTIRAETQVGIHGHGQGKAIHSDGSEYEIMY